VSRWVTPRVHEVDLSLPPSRRWNKVAKATYDDAHDLIDNAIGDVSEWVRWTASKGLSVIYKMTGGLYMDDIKGWAKRLDIKHSDLLLANLSYEGSHLRACTSIAVPTKKMGWLHVRNMDWPLYGCGRTTMVLKLKKDKRDIISIGNPGLVGILSGMVPGKFSITLNWAPPVEWPDFRVGPVFLIRKVLEEAKNYTEAVSMLSHERLSTCAFFMVVGTRTACVIERLKGDVEVRQARGKPIVCANTFQSRRFRGYNSEHLTDEEFDDSEYRFEAASDSASLSTTSVKGGTKMVHRSPLLNMQTCQQMVFAPKTGEYFARGRDNDDLLDELE